MHEDITDKSAASDQKSCSCSYLSSPGRPGYSVSSPRRRGSRKDKTVESAPICEVSAIPQALELLDKNTIAQYLDVEHKDYLVKIAIFPELSSTSTYLAELLKAQTSDIRICFAEQQTAGKGRLGRGWVSPFARNIYLSLAWQFTVEPSTLAGLGLAIGVAVTEALKSYGIETDIGLKWPNDVLWQKRKLAGILIELSTEEVEFQKRSNVIIGVGLNVDMPATAAEEISQPWCDVTQIINFAAEAVNGFMSSSPIQRNKLAGLLLNQLLNVLTTYQASGLTPFLEKWRQLDVTYGKKVTIVTAQQNVDGLGCGINEEGCFLLKDHSGKIHTFAAGEVSLRF